MSINPFSKNLQNVTDPSEWQNTKLPALATLDTLQRCYICKEFLKAPVSTSCNHTFCSHCIREYLISKNYCPLCKTEQFESNLKREVLLEEIISCYTNIRPLLLDTLRSPSQNEINSSKFIDTNSENKALKRQSSNDIIEVSSDDSEKKASNHNSKRIRKDSPKKDLDAIPKRNEMVECPICSEIMPADILQGRHIDDCLNGRKTPITYGSRFKVSNKKLPKPNIESFFQRAPVKVSSNPIPKLDQCKFYFDEVPRNISEIKKLPKLDFASLTTPKLKEKMASLKLPLQGTRQQLELRYNHYYVLYNSNLDSNHPVPEKLLKQKLSQWEHAHSAFTSSSNDIFSTKGQISHKSITDKDFSSKEWLRVYSAEFKQLVKQAKETQINSKKETEKLVSCHTNDLSHTSESIVIENDLQEKQLNSIDLDIKSAIATSPLFVNEDKL